MPIAKEPTLGVQNTSPLLLCVLNIINIVDPLKSLGNVVLSEFDSVCFFDTE